MQLTAALARLLPKLTPAFESQRNLVRDAWHLCQLLPGGNVLFSRLLGGVAPYSGTIGAVVTALGPGRAEVRLGDRPKLRNHLHSIHAVALVNLAELAGNVALAYSLPDDARFIVTGLEIEYLKKARGTIVAVGECPIPRSNERAVFEVRVQLKDAAGDEVARARLRSLVGPKPGRERERDPSTMN